MIEVVQAFDRAPITHIEADDAAALERKIEGPNGNSPTATLGSSRISGRTSCAGLRY
jgi:hypothetical protein